MLTRETFPRDDQVVFFDGILDTISIGCNVAKSIEGGVGCILW
jgi:hypothetical protein